MPQTIQKYIQNIVNEIQTAEELALLKDIIAKLHADLFKPRASVYHESVFEGIPSHIASVFTLALADKFLEEHPEEMKAFLAELERAISHLKVLRLEISFEPTGKLFEHLINWIRKELGTGIVMEITVDKGLLGGARMMYGGKYKELSLPLLIEQAAEKERARIIEQLHK
jgi:hypothetical protein